MSTKDYTPSVATALRLIEKFGAAATLTRHTAGAYNPATGAATVTTSTQTALCVRTSWASKDIDGTLIKLGDVRMILAASGLTTEPAVDDTITFSGVTYTIKSVDPVSPADVVIVYILNVRV